MRIRSIHPEFWRSEDVGAMDWATRLVFIGLWSYVDDNGVGRDNEKIIVADIFPLEDDPRETFATVSRALQTLSDGGQIVRYTVDGRHFLYVSSWGKWQRIDRPGKQRYPLPTSDDVEFATSSRECRESAATGEGEKGRRVEEREAVTDASSSPSPRAARKTALSDDWSPNEKHATTAIARGLDLDLVAEKFRAHAEANDRRQVSWNGAFTQWLLNEKPVLRAVGDSTASLLTHKPLERRR